jgi:hypothetical protein
MQRRQYLAATGAGCALSLTGCLGLFETEQRATRNPPLVADRPDAVYIPSHVEGMQMVDMAMSGRLRLAVSYSFPHRFWLVDGDRSNLVEVDEDDSAHVMVSVWDAETETAIPSSNASVVVSKDGDVVADRSMWRMLSQNMGFHYGDNVTLDGDGDYEVDVEFGPVTTRRTGGFEGLFGELSSATFSLSFSRSTLEDLTFETLDDRKGQRGAVEPMSMEMMPVPQLPAADAMPGTVLGPERSGDAKFVVAVLETPPSGVEGAGTYLAVSPRTPYNRYPLPFMSLTATLTRDGETVHEGTLTPTLDPDLQYHYGTVVDGVEAGDTLTITPETPPQVSRHEGFETAFLDMAPVELTVEATDTAG